MDRRILFQVAGHMKDPYRAYRRPVNSRDAYHQNQTVLEFGVDRINVFEAHAFRVDLLHHLSVSTPVQDPPLERQDRPCALIQHRILRWPRD